ncbi:MAG: HDIG domain-containing protein [Deltaproteobacteria bacterium]|nr:HDIG domain-containing protein [Deltaproteobacteria bacterium]
MSAVSTLWLSVLFSSAFALVATADLLFFPESAPGSALPTAIRVPTTVFDGEHAHNGIRIAPGQRIPPQLAAKVAVFYQGRRPPSPVFFAGLIVAFALLLLLYGRYLVMLGGEASLRRAQMALLSALLLTALVGKALLTFSTLSPFWIPACALVVPLTTILDRRAAAATGMTLALIIALLVPIDFLAFFVLFAQTLAAAAAGGRRSSLIGYFTASLVSGVCFVVAALMLEGPAFIEGLLNAGLTQLLASDLAAATLSPLASAPIGLLVAPLLRAATGHLSRRRLTRLADFDQPLLRKIASSAPGTWAHSLNMANMGEMAANAIGADGLLVRVGAYYHDLGKALEPEYFVENQRGNNPHDELAPEVSADAIFAHVSEGVKIARRAGLPEQITEFIYTHHGKTTLEYFWHKVQQSGNPAGLSQRDFRYPGVAPQTRETGIMSLCDAAEAASKSLSAADEESIREVVRRIVFTKIEQGMLDNSGLSLHDLRRISESMVETLRASLHTRVKYPWQERQQAQGAPNHTTPNGEAQAAARPRRAGSVVTVLEESDPAWAHDKKQV